MARRDVKVEYESPWDNPVIKEWVTLELEQSKAPQDQVFSAIPPQLALGVGLVLFILIIIALAIKVA